jgi:hypothetical protein
VLAPEFLGVFVAFGTADTPKGWRLVGCPVFDARGQNPGNGSRNGRALPNFTTFDVCRGGYTSEISEIPLSSSVGEISSGIGSSSRLPERVILSIMGGRGNGSPHAFFAVCVHNKCLPSLVAVILLSGVASLYLHIC